MKVIRHTDGTARLISIHYLGIWMLIFGARCLAAGPAVSYLPYWDQWFGEFETLFVPFLTGDLSVFSFFHPHNNHIIATTRATSMMTFVANGYWNTKTLVIVSAAVFSFWMTLLTFLAGRITDSGLSRSLQFIIPAMALIPYSFFNSVCGFNVQYYYLSLFSVVFIYLLCNDRQAPTRNRILATAAIVIAFLSMASGFFAAIVIIVIRGLQQIAARKVDKRHLVEMEVLAVVSVVGYLLTPKIARFAAGTYTELYEVLVACLSWPFGSNVIVAGINLLPIALLAFTLIKDGAENSHPGWFFLGLGGWVLLQVGGISYGRAGIFEPIDLARYSEILSILYVVNFTSLMIVTGPGKCRWQRLRPVVMVASAFWILIGFGSFTWRESIPQLNMTADAVEKSERDFRRQIATGNWSLQKKKLTKLGRELSQKNYAFFYDPERRYSIPQFGVIALDRAPRRMTKLFPPALTGVGHPSRFDRFTQLVFDNAALVAAAGALLLILGGVRRYWHCSLWGSS